jgi:hypothetical protein
MVQGGLFYFVILNFSQYLFVCVHGYVHVFENDSVFVVCHSVYMVQMKENM